MGLDFRRAAELFMASEGELASALDLDAGTLRRFRQGGPVPKGTLLRMADVLTERGRAMVRVGEMIREDATGVEGNGAGEP